MEKLNNRDSKVVPMIQFILFAMLVVATPFVVVTKYLQGTVHTISHLNWKLLGMEFPIVVTVSIACFIGLLIWQAKNINLRRIRGGLVVLAMISLSQWVQDLYAGMSIYDLQNNWHYVAYSAYIFVFFRAFHVRGVSKTTMILASFFSAMGLSTFDEFFQLFFSGRIFDVCDIAKDMWGAMMGLVLVLFVSETYGTINFKNHTIWQRKLKDYLRYPLSALAITGLLALCAILISPLLTDHRHVGNFIMLFLAFFVIAMIIVHLLQLRRIRRVFITAVVICATLLAGSILINRNTYINYYRNGFTVYKGIPIPFFDLLVYPNDMPRLVDKKHFFNSQDKQFFYGLKPDILLIGSGSKGLGGKGFSVEYGTIFVYNRYRESGTQLIVLKTDEAVKVFNRLKKAGKHVLFVLNNTS